MARATKKVVQASRIEIVPLSDLKPMRENARTHSKKQIRQIADSIHQFGWTNPILTDEDKRVIAGAGRCKAGEQLGIMTVPVIVVRGLTAAQKRILALADNKIAANAGWDHDILATQLADLLTEHEVNIEITGFSPAEIDTILVDFNDLEEQVPDDHLPTIGSKPVSRRGDLWLLGRHRLCCGDAKSANDMTALMGHERAAMVFTDPPFNVRIGSVQGRGKIRHREFVEASGELSPEAYTSFLAEALSLAVKYSVEGAILFVCIDWRHIGELLSAGKQADCELINLAVWVKSNAGQGSFYRSQHELVFVFKNGEAPHLNNIELGRNGRNRSNVWAYAGVNAFRAGRLDDLSVHPTVKPVAMVADAMRDCSRRGDIVLDQFIGSGTSILAAERVGRRAYGMEIDPLYVDASVRRWQDFTRRDAVLAGTEKTFDEVATERVATKAAHE